MLSKKELDGIRHRVAYVADGRNELDFWQMDTLSREDAPALLKALDEALAKLAAIDALGKEADTPG